MAKKYGPETYPDDKRRPLGRLDYAFNSFVNAGWIPKTIYKFDFVDSQGKEWELPINVYYTPQSGEALYLLSGIHGEEPAGPNAVARNVRYLIDLGKKIPLVVAPMLNPIGYVLNQRYFNGPYKSVEEGGISIGDSDHLLLDPKAPEKTRRESPIHPAPGAFTKAALDLAKNRRPKIWVHLHEDNEVYYEANGQECRILPYLFSHGILKRADPAAAHILNIFYRNREKISGHTGLNQRITDGIAEGDHDGSVDELVASEWIKVNGLIQKGVNASHVIVFETHSKSVNLRRRVRAHGRVICSLDKLWELRQRD